MWISVATFISTGSRFNSFSFISVGDILFDVQSFLISFEDKSREKDGVNSTPVVVLKVQYLALDVFTSVACTCPVQNILAFNLTMSAMSLISYSISVNIASNTEY